MAELDDLYQQVIFDHNKNPKNYRKIESTGKVAEGYNPFCGDKITVYLDMEGNKIRDISFEGSGCAISKASASLMTMSLKGKSVQDAENLFAGFHKMVTGKKSALSETRELGKLVVFSGVSEFPIRVKCASLSWHTFRAALQGKKDLVSTE